MLEGGVGIDKLNLSQISEQKVFRDLKLTNQKKYQGGRHMSPLWVTQ